MKRRWTFLAAAVVLADLLALGAVWHVAPTVSLTVGLAVPEVEQILSTLYVDPIREDVATGEVHRPAHPRSALVLTAGRAGDARARAIARALARRDVIVLLPAASAEADASLAHARAFGLPVRVEDVATFDHGEGRSTFVTRAAYAWRLMRLAHGLLIPR
jgi:hypothetical protein